MQKQHGDAILAHRLKKEIIATKVANRFVNRLGIVAPFSLTEEEGAAFGQAAAAFLAAERLFRMRELWAAIDEADVPEEVRLALFEQASTGLQLHIADLLRCTAQDLTPGELVDMLKPGLAKLEAMVDDLLRPEARAEAGSLRAELEEMDAPREIADRIIRLFELNGAIGLAVLGQKLEGRRGPADPRLHQARRGAGARLGAERGQPFPGARPVGAAADRRPRPRFRAAPARIPRPAQGRRPQGDGRQMGGRARGRASTSSAAPSTAPAPPRSPPPRCSPRSPPRRGCCWRASRQGGPCRHRAVVMISSRCPSGSSK